MFALAFLFVLTTGLQAMASIGTYADFQDVSLSSQASYLEEAAIIKVQQSATKTDKAICCDRDDKQPITSSCTIDCKLLASSMAVLFEKARDEPKTLFQVRTYSVDEKVHLRPPNG